MSTFHTVEESDKTTDEAGRALAPQAPPPGNAEAVPLLDIDGRNVPGEKYKLPTWNKKQWGIRQTILTRLRYWQHHGYQCLWVTLTSSPKSSKLRLRKDFQTLRKRIERKYGFDDIAYVCVDTVEGHGVLHMIWAWKDPKQSKRGTFYISFDWLQSQWSDIHGAFHVNIQRIRPGDLSSRRLSRYIVAQYCGGQSGLVRLSQSRAEQPFTKMRQGLLKFMRHMPERYECADHLRSLPPDSFDKAFSRFFWNEFRFGWQELAIKRFCEVFNAKLVWTTDKLERL
jgi:hypothetical protein